MRTALVTVGAVLAVLIGIAAAGPDEPVLPDEGRDLFFVQGCHGCHTIGAVGTPIGPDLSGVGLRYTPFELAAWLLDPSARTPSAHMPKLELTAHDVDALAAYLASLRRPAS